MMKKISVAVLACLIMLGFAGCMRTHGKNDNPPLRLQAAAQIWQS